MSPAGDQLTQPRAVHHAVCLGCGCACDDIAVHVFGDRITDARNACALGVRWFGDGVIPSAIRVNGADAALSDALAAITASIKQARQTAIYLAPEITCEAQREAIGLGDLVRGTVDTISSTTVLPTIIASQERGRASATLGELRNRADVVVFWAVDPNERYPRFPSRYTPDPIGLYVDGGRKGRRVVAVDVGDARGPADADVRVAVDAQHESATLVATAAIIRNSETSFDEPLASTTALLAKELAGGRYVALVADAEPRVSSSTELRPHFSDASRAGALIALAQALNGPTRCALNMLRAGGNRSGAEAVLTAHAGYPTGVSFANGFPLYRPHDSTRGADAVLIVGDASQVPVDVMTRFSGGPVSIIGPRASVHRPAQSQAGLSAEERAAQAARAGIVTIDTGIAGIHVNGTALRMDDVPLRLRPSIHRGLDPAEVLRALRERVLQ